MSEETVTTAPETFDLLIDEDRTDTVLEPIPTGPSKVVPLDDPDTGKQFLEHEVPNEPQPEQEPTPVKKSTGRGRLNSNERVRKSTQHGTTIYPTGTKTKKPRPRLSDSGKFQTIQLRAFKAMLTLGATEPVEAVPLDVIAKKAGVTTHVIRRGIGPTDRTAIPKHEERYGYKCLIGRGMVKIAPNHEGDGRASKYLYYLTALGVKKAEEQRDAGNLKLGKPKNG